MIPESDNEQEQNISDASKDLEARVSRNDSIVSPPGFTGHGKDNGQETGRVPTPDPEFGLGYENPSPGLAPPPPIPHPPSAHIPGSRVASSIYSVDAGQWDRKRFTGEGFRNNRNEVVSWPWPFTPQNENPKRTYGDLPIPDEFWIDPAEKGLVTEAEKPKEPYGGLPLPEDSRDEVIDKGTTIETPPATGWFKWKKAVVEEKGKEEKPKEIDSSLSPPGESTIDAAEKGMANETPAATGWWKGGWIK